MSANVMAVVSYTALIIACANFEVCRFLLEACTAPLSIFGSFLIIWLSLALTLHVLSVAHANDSWSNFSLFLFPFLQLMPVYAHSQRKSAYSK